MYYKCITMKSQNDYEEVNEMEERTLIIQSKKYRGESTVVSMRLPTELINEIDNIAKTTGRTRNEIMQTCLEFAVDNLRISG